MWKPPKISWKEESELLKGFDQIIKDGWPHLEMYLTSRGWERKQRYE